MKELDEVLSIAAADYRVHIKAIAQLNAAIDELNNQNVALQKANDSLKTQNAALLKNINTPVPASNVAPDNQPAPATPIEGTPDNPDGKDDAK